LRSKPKPVTEVFVQLPLPPSTNVMWRAVPYSGHCRVIVSREGRAFRDECAPIMAEYRGPFQSDVSVEATFFFKNRRSDLDNRIKALLDVLEVTVLGFGLVQNDRQVTELHCYKKIDPQKPRVEVRVREVVR